MLLSWDLESLDILYWRIRLIALFTGHSAVVALSSAGCDTWVTLAFCEIGHPTPRCAIVTVHPIGLLVPSGQLAQFSGIEPCPV